MEHPGGKSPSLDGGSSSSSKMDYEVFLNFRGPDSRLTITDSLYAAMIQVGIRVFKDDEELRVGEEIGGELLRAISHSKIYVPIFSRDYASSKWCLRELAYMVESRKRDKKVILPIFYGVDASDLKLRTGLYSKALRKHERQSGEDTAKRWEEALQDVARIKGWNLKDHGKEKLIALILKEVFDKLTVMELLGLGPSGVRFLVIHGMGGIGKTTLAKAIFKGISSQFQSSSFLSDIRVENISSLQRKLLRDILDIRDSCFLDYIVVLVVLDDMDKRDQLIKLACKSWFGSGSRIIITTRNTYFLAPETDTLDDNVIPVRHQDFFFYEMKEMQFDHALQLFNKHSFESDSTPHDYIDISREIVRTTGGLPLALEVIGSMLHSKSMITWKDTLKKLQKVPNRDVQKQLSISYEELEYEQKLVIKDCLLLEEINTSISQLKHLKYLEISEELRVTVEELCNFAIPLLPDSIGGLKSLSMLKVENQDDVRELPDSIGELLDLKHLSLRNCTKLQKLSDSIGELRLLLCLDLSYTGISGLLDSIGGLESLLRMDLSRTRIVELPDSIGNLRRLKVMCLDGTKIRELPKNIWTLENLEELIARGCENLEGKIPSEIAGLSQLKILNLPRSKVSRLPITTNGLYSLQELVLSDCNWLQLLPNLPTRLAKVELSSASLQAIPNLSNLTNLLHLDIRRVANPTLEWLGRLNELQFWRLVLSDSNLPPTDLGSLSQLRSLEITCADPRSLTRLPSSLEVLSLEDVKTPMEWPMFSNLGSLSELKLSRCWLTEIEFGNVLGQLENLQRLQVRKCELLVRLSNRSSLKELRMLSVEYCPQLMKIESEPSSLGDCSSTFTERPIPDTQKLEKLRSLRVYYCESVRRLPGVPDACDVGKQVILGGGTPEIAEARDSAAAAAAKSAGHHRRCRAWARAPPRRWDSATSHTPPPLVPPGLPAISERSTGLKHVEGQKRKMSSWMVKNGGAVNKGVSVKSAGLGHARETKKKMSSRMVICCSFCSSPIDSIFTVDSPLLYFKRPKQLNK
ncbi:hypothetical protein BT93_C2267 [Corymbia citriodora subsp. variegata]|nr:hypothetical protein BT93_C2267 [Corymbia citriodora subsp. variegata]